jgi:RimJ/RimL family protein N-acetyltransferase
MSILRAEKTLAQYRILSAPLRGDRTVRIVACRGYGVIAPGEYTTNGSVITLVAALPFWTSDADSEAFEVRYEWKSFHPAVSSALTTPERLLEELARAYVAEFPTSALLQNLNPKRSGESLPTSRTEIPMTARTLPAVTLKPLTEAHLPHVMRWVNDSSVMGYFAAHQTAISEAEELAYIRKLIASTTDFVYSVFDTESGAYVGQVSLNQIYWLAGTARLFMVVLPEFQHRGYGAAILREIQARAFFTHGLHKVWLIVREENTAAQARYLRAGFRKEGILRQEYKVADRYYDMVRMAILEDEWRARASIA